MPMQVKLSKGAWIKGVTKVEGLFHPVTKRMHSVAVFVGEVPTEHTYYETYPVEEVVEIQGVLPDPPLPGRRRW